MVDYSLHIPLVRTKLHRPPLSAVHVRRQHLLDQLDERIDRVLTLVSAPAGYGKSTLVSCWLESCNIPVAWLSLDKTDNDLRLFISYLLVAVQSISRETGKVIQTLLRAQDLPPLPILAGHLINELDSIDQAFILAIDDYHVIQNKAIHELLDEILLHPPHAMHLVLLSRVDPPLAITKVRAKGQMTEIRTRDLRFSRIETLEFLQLALKTAIEETLVNAIEEKTEGWITGLHLTALTLRNRRDLGSGKTGMPDKNRLVTDYLVEEILSQQSPLIQEYLLKTSLLDRFCGPLCDAVCLRDGKTDEIELGGWDFIQHLKDTNLFAIRLDDEHRWFRYHHLFQNLLNRRLEHRFKPEEINKFHVLASTWLAEHGQFEEAIRHALKGGDLNKAVEIVGNARHVLMNSDRWHTLERWLKLFSYEAVQQHPHLMILRCWLDLCHWYRIDYLIEDLDRSNALLEVSILENCEVKQLKAEVAAMRSNLAYWLLKPRYGVSLTEQVFSDSPKENECVQSTALLGWGALWQMLGDIKQGERVLWERMKDGTLSNPSSRARLLQGMCLSYWPEADAQKLQQAASRLLEVSHKYELSWNHSFARYFLGLLHYDRNELDEAVAQLEIIVCDPYSFPIQSLTHCAFLLSLSYQALGQADRAREVANSIATLAFERGNKLFIDLTEAFQADLDLRQGRIAQAEQWGRTYVAPPPHGMQRYFNAELTSIKILIAGNTPASLKSAAEQLESMHKLLIQIHHRRLLIDVLVMKALLEGALGRESSAFESLEEALILAGPREFIRPFLDLGQPVFDLLKCLAKRKPNLEYSGRILAAFSSEKPGNVRDVSDDPTNKKPSEHSQVLLEPLTNREIEILSILAKRLSNDVIAQKLFISPETVKRHLYNIYQKLGVKNRQQAIAKAESIGML